MQDKPVSLWLTAARPAWLGHQTALAARLAQPGAARLTEEQEALALGIAQRLVLNLAESLPLASEARDIWARWESGGLPGSAALAPALLARVEEFRWRRNQPQAPTVAPAPLFQHQRPSVDAAIALSAAEAETSETERAYLALRIADGARCNAIGQPLLLPAELSAVPHRALLLDLAAQDLALVGGGTGRAADMAQAIDALMSVPKPHSIDAAARRYHAAIKTMGILPEAVSAALFRHDWLAVIALLAADSGHGFSGVALGLLGASDEQIVAALTTLGIAVQDVGPLLDALADVPGRPEQYRAPFESALQQDTVSAVTARAASLRGDGT